MEEFSEVEPIDERLVTLLEQSESEEDITEQSYCPFEEARVKLPKSRLRERRNEKSKAKAETNVKIMKKIRDSRKLKC